MSKSSIQRIAAFSLGEMGGNPAGVLLADRLPAAEEMQRIAAEVGYSETVFVAPEGKASRIRYFAPEAEVPFCGHATIALGAALGAAYGAGRHELILNHARIDVTASEDAMGWRAELTSPGTKHRAVEASLLGDALAHFGWTESDLDPALPPARINGGTEHLLLALSRQALLQKMSYDFDTGAALMRASGLGTINLVWRETAARFHARNAFAGHGVYEDPATGAAAAALAGYLRDTGKQDQPFTILQGADMGAPSELRVTPLPGRGAPVRVAGHTRRLAA